MKASALTPHLICALCFCATPLALNGAIFFDDLDSYASGSQMHGQGGWKGWDNDSGAGALVSSAVASSGLNSIDISGASDLVHEFTGATSGQWAFSTMVYIPSASTGTSYLILLSTYNDGGPNVWSIQTNFNMDSGLATSDLGGGGTLPLVMDAWVPYRVDIDLDTNTFDEYYDNQALGTGTWTTGAVQIQAVDLFANSAGSIFYDDVSLVPEPTTFALVALGAMGLFQRRRRFLV